MIAVASSAGLLFLIASAICFALAFAGVKVGQLNTTAGGWMFLVLAILVGAL